MSAKLIWSRIFVVIAVFSAFFIFTIVAWEQEENPGPLDQWMMKVQRFMLNEGEWRQVSVDSIQVRQGKNG